MPDTEKPDWRVASNAEYQKVMSTVMGLATASLILPVLFLRDLAGVAENSALNTLLSPIVYWSWGLLALSILSAVVFHYASAKWVKMAYGGDVCLTECTLERVLDFSFWLSVLFFLGGVGALVLFCVTYRPEG